MQGAFAVTRPYPTNTGSHTFICVARRAQPIGNEALRLRAHMAAEIRADSRENFLRSKHSKRLGDMAR